MSSSPLSDRWRVQCWGPLKWVAHTGFAGRFAPAFFPTHAEAVAYADRMARTEQETRA